MCLRSVTTAAKISPVIEVTAMKNCSKAALCSALRSMNGPCPCAVPQTAMAAVRKLATVDPAMPKRIAAQMTKGKMTKANTSSRMASPIRPPEGELSAGTLGYFIRPGRHSMTRGDWKVFLDYADHHFGR